MSEAGENRPAEVQPKASHLGAACVGRWVKHSGDLGFLKKLKVSPEKVPSDLVRVFCASVPHL